MLEFKRKKVCFCFLQKEYEEESINTMSVAIKQIHWFTRVWLYKKLWFRKEMDSFST